MQHTCTMQVSIRSIVQHSNSFLQTFAHEGVQAEEHLQWARSLVVLGNQ